MSRLGNIKKSMGNWFVRNWLKYYYFKFFYSVLVLGPTSLILVLYMKSPEFATLFYTTLILIASYVLIINALGPWVFRDRVICENPVSFLQAEKFAHRVQISSLISVLIWFSWDFLLPFALDNFVVSPQKNTFVSNSLYTIMISLILFSEVEMLNRIFEGVPPLKGAKARVDCALQTLSRGLDKRTEAPSQIKEALKMYNSHLRREYSYIIREPSKFYRYFFLAIQSDKTSIVKRVFKALERLSTVMEDQQHDPADVLRILRTAIGERKYSLESICTDIEVEPTLRKWLSTHSDQINVVIGIVAVIISVMTRILD